jgi:hypothetical protein
VNRLAGNHLQIVEPGRSVITPGTLTFVVFPRDLVSNSPEKVPLRIAARVARSMNFDSAGKAVMTTPATETWIIRDQGYNLRVSPLRENAEMVMLRSEDPEFSFPSGRYELMLGGQAYDFVVAGEVTDPAHCVEGVATVRGPVFYECKPVLAAQMGYYRPGNWCIQSSPRFCVPDELAMMFTSSSRLRADAARRQAPAAMLAGRSRGVGKRPRLCWNPLERRITVTVKTPGPWNRPDQITGYAGEIGPRPSGCWSAVVPQIPNPASSGAVLPEVSRVAASLSVGRGFYLALQLLDLTLESFGKRGLDVMVDGTSRRPPIRAVDKFELVINLEPPAPETLLATADECVQSLDNAVGELLFEPSEIIEVQFAIAEQGLGDFLRNRGKNRGC